VEPVELEGWVTAHELRIRLLVVALGVHLEDVGQLHGQRRIDVDGDARNPLGGPQALQGVDHLLRALEREGGDEDLAAATDRAVHRRRESLVDLFDGGVVAIAVRALADEAVDARRDLRVPQDGEALASEIDREGDAGPRAVVLDIEHDHRAAQHVAGVEQLEHDPRRDGVRAPVGQADDLAEQPGDVVLVVERLDGLHVQALALDQLADVPGVRLLNHGRVEQHGRAQIPRGRRRVDRPPVAVLVEQRQQARVVDVRVREHDRRQLVDGDLHRAVALVGFTPPALEHAAVEQDRRLGRAQHVLRPGHAPCCTDELELDQSPVLW